LQVLGDCGVEMMNHWQTIHDHGSTKQHQIIDGIFKQSSGQVSIVRVFQELPSFDGKNPA
jgi:hypothetical protein